MKERTQQKVLHLLETACLPNAAMERSRVTLPQKAVKTTEEASLGSHVRRRLQLLGVRFRVWGSCRGNYSGRIKRHHPVP